MVSLTLIVVTKLDLNLISLDYGFYSKWIANRITE
jgi:hypothetical protein